MNGYPLVQRTAIVLLEKGASFDRVDVNLAAKPDWFPALSPTGKVPLFKVGQADGSDVVLFESMVICEYFEESFPASQHGGRLWRHERASLLQWQETLPSDSSSTCICIRRSLPADC